MQTIKDDWISRRMLDFLITPFVVQQRLDRTFNPYQKRTHSAFGADAQLRSSLHLCIVRIRAQHKFVENKFARDTDVA